MTTAMQKWEIAAPGDAHLTMVTASKPWPKPGEILLEVDAVSLNYRERWISDDGRHQPSSDARVAPGRPGPDRRTRGRSYPRNGRGRQCPEVAGGGRGRRPHLDRGPGRSARLPAVHRAAALQPRVGHRRALEDMVRAVDRLGLKPVIDARYSFAELPKAMAHLRRGAFGKVVVQVRESGAAPA
jgi:NADPH:quinone reductase-like Zn-dependent oxidoreductase